jgi:nucleotide-binding universal stress UspA family protein
MEERGFVPNIERLLLAVDDSPNGRFASRLAGLIAGARGIQITVMPVGEGVERNVADNKNSSKASDNERAAKQAVANAATDSKKSEPEQDHPVDVVVRKQDTPDSDAVAEEARKGYDLLFIGLERTRTRSGRFHQDIESIVSGFEGPSAIVEAKGNHRKHPEQSDIEVLVPVNGSEMARRGAEIAIAIARVLRAPLQAIYVSETAGKERGSRKRGARSRWHEQAILKDIVELADHQDQTIRTAVRSTKAAEDAILSEVSHNENKLIVMGVGRPATEPLFFGEIAAAVADKSPASILLVAS